jgi:hypothetical protein
MPSSEPFCFRGAENLPESDPVMPMFDYNDFNNENLFDADDNSSPAKDSSLMSFSAGYGSLPFSFDSSEHTVSASQYPSKNLQITDKSQQYLSSHRGSTSSSSSLKSIGLDSPGTDQTSMDGAAMDIGDTSPGIWDDFKMDQFINLSGSSSPPIANEPSPGRATKRRKAQKARQSQPTVSSALFIPSG